MGDDARPSWMSDMLARCRFAVPEDLPDLFLEFGRRLGASDVWLFLVDYDQRMLTPLPRRAGSHREPLVIDATVAGRCYRAVEIRIVVNDGGGHRVWVPVLDGSERLGALELVFSNGVDGEVGDDVRTFADTVGELVITKSAYGDFFECARRTQPMSLAAELARQQLPPLTFATGRIAISGTLFPVYDLAGDSFDYAVDAETARFAIFDAAGHDLNAGILASVAIAAYRNSRRRRHGLEETVEVLDRALEQHFDRGFVTGVVCELELESGRLQWFVAGHPRPLLLRAGRVVKTLEGRPGRPFGLGTRATVATEVLEPADQVLLFTDGVVEARDSSGRFFGEARLADFVCRVAASGTPPPETMRELVHAILDHQSGSLQDDAATILVEWRGSGSERLEV